MNKAAIVSRVCDRTGLARADVGGLVDAVFEALADCMMEDGRMTVVGFGSFRVRERPAREHVTPGLAGRVRSQAYRTVVFRTSEVLRKRLALRR